MSDTDQRFHETWLGMLQPTVGLVVSVPVLVEAQCAERLTPEAQSRLRTVCTLDADGALLCQDLDALLCEGLGYPADAVVRDGLEAFALFVPEGPQVIQPTRGLCDPSNPARPLVLLWEIPDGLDFDRPESVTGPFDYPPTAKFDRVLRHAGIPIGLLTNGRAFRFLYAPSGEASGSLTFRLDEMLSVGGRPILDAFVMLLSAQRLLGVAAERALPRILEDSRRWQARVSERLADQVLEAAALLLEGLQDAAQRDGDSSLSEVAAVDGDHIHRGVLSALLRIVFLLYAEDAELMPVDHEVYRRGLSVANLYDQLRADAGAYPDSMDRRFGAWGYLLTAFRTVFLGASSGDLRLPPRRGTLFDPHRFPFLEGWTAGAAPIGDPEARAAMRVPTVSDAVVLAVLERLVVLEGQRISYRSLDVEQIGSVYEQMLGYTVVQLADDAVCVRGSRRWFSVSDLGDVPAARRVRWLRDTVEVAAAAAERVARAYAEARTPEAKREALALLAAKTRSGDPMARRSGALVLQPKGSMESSTSHYTPRSLCEPLVARALAPLLRALGEAPTAEQILSLKVCDPAMGSGAFLVETCRVLADHLVAAWRREPSTRAERAEVEDRVTVARRIVAQRCLYGVDRNADAVELAKLSLWLVTLARDLPFTFVDHAFRHGDSIVGLGLDQIARFHWKPDAEEDPVLRSEIEAVLAEALPIRTRIEELASATSAEEQATKERLLWDAEDAIDRLRFAGDLVLAAFFSGASVAEREGMRQQYRDAVIAWLRGDVGLPPDVLAARATFRRSVPAFHWPLELAEIFHAARRDPLERPRAGETVAADARMDAFVGNMPFIGGRRIATVHGERYAGWLCEAFEASGEVDYVTYFFRRANELLGDNGSIGLIATNSIAQGDTRRAGLQRLLRQGLVIYDAHSKMPWPGDANVLIAPVLLAKGTVREHASVARLNGSEVAIINSRLRSYEEREDPARLEENKGCAFVGCFLRGEGFVLSADEGTSLRNEAPEERSVVRPYLVGEDVTKDPRQSASRFVVDFAVMDLDEARSFKKAMAIIEERVRPDRERLRTTGADASHRRYWWRFANTRNDLRAWLAENKECLVLPRVAKHLLVARAATDQVFSEQVVVFGMNRASTLGVLQSRIHEVWVRLLSSTMGEGLRYSASDCFDTFPFPRADPRAELVALDEVAGRLEAARVRYMLEEGIGLTETYNRLKNPELHEPRVLDLRKAHEENDAAVLVAYDEADPGRGWSQLIVPPFCPRTDDDRIRVEGFEDAVIARLFALNERRAREHAATHVADIERTHKKTRGAKKRTAAPKRTKARNEADR